MKSGMRAKDNAHQERVIENLLFFIEIEIIAAAVSKTHGSLSFAPERFEGAMFL